MRIHDDTFHGASEVLPFRAGGLAAVIPRRDKTLAVGIEERFFRIEAETFGGIEGPINSISIELAWDNAGDECVPIKVGAIGDRIEGNDARGPRAIVMVEEKQINADGLARVKAEIRTGRGEFRAQGSAAAFQSTGCHERPE